MGSKIELKEINALVISFTELTDKCYSGGVLTHISSHPVVRYKVKDLVLLSFGYDHGNFPPL